MSTDTIAPLEQLTPAHSRIEFWLWPNVASLDAPLIAVLWQLLLAHGLRVRLNPREPPVLALAVWSLYLGDRILDTLRPRDRGCEPARKSFYRRHHRAFALAGFCLTALVIPLAYVLLKRPTFYSGVALAVPVGCYFAFVHLAPPRWRARWPREAAVSSLFTLGTFLAVWIANGRNLPSLAIPAILFSSLCWLNCSAIETWEWESAAEAAGVPSTSARWASRHLSIIAIAVALLAAVINFLLLAPSTFCLAAFWSAIALALLGACRSQLRVTVLRVAADAALCTPLFVLALT